MTKTSLDTMAILSKLEENGKRLEKQKKEHDNMMERLDKNFKSFFKKVLTLGQ